MTEGELALAGIAVFTAAIAALIGVTIRDVLRARRSKRTNDRINRLD